MLLVIGQYNGYMSLNKLKFGAKYYVYEVLKLKVKCRMGITIFKILVWGGISSYIWLFYSSADILH